VGYPRERTPLRQKNGLRRNRRKKDPAGVPHGESSGRSSLKKPKGFNVSTRNFTKQLIEENLIGSFQSAFKKPSNNGDLHVIILDPEWYVGKKKGKLNRSSLAEGERRNPRSAFTNGLYAGGRLKGGLLQKPHARECLRTYTGVQRTRLPYVSHTGNQKKTKGATKPSNCMSYGVG